MKKKWKDLWVATLRSGNFKQARGRLRNSSNECCCLGVLADIVDPKGWNKYCGEWDHHNDGHVLAPSICTEVEMSSETENKLVDLNDSRKYSFSRISTWIEKNL